MIDKGLLISLKEAKEFYINKHSEALLKYNIKSAESWFKRIKILDSKIDKLERKIYKSIDKTK